VLSLLGGAEYYEDFINTLTAMCDYVQSKHRSPKKIMISFDEYGGMIRPNAPLNPGWGRYNMTRSHYRFNPERKYILHDPDKMPDREWPGGDRIHMLSMASIQLALLRHADRVKIGCMTGGLGALCSANHDHVWRSASHYAFMSMLQYAKGTSMQVSVDSETFDIPDYAIDDTSQYTGKQGLNYIDSACAWDRENNRLAVFVINRNEKDDYAINLDAKGFKGYTKCTHLEIACDDPDLKSRFGNDELFVPVENKEAAVKAGVLTTHVKPLSFNVLVLEK
jgi:alpha-N-arabinofuranosidase